MRLAYVITWMYKCRQRQDAGSDHDVCQGREQAVPAHPELTAFVHPCTAVRKLRYTQHILWIVVMHGVIEILVFLFDFSSGFGHE